MIMAANDIREQVLVRSPSPGPRDTEPAWRSRHPRRPERRCAKCIAARQLRRCGYGGDRSFQDVVRVLPKRSASRTSPRLASSLPAAFVALGAARLVVGRLVAETLRVEQGENFIQYDALIGPAARTVEERKALPECYCVERAAIMERVREKRLAAA